MTPPVTHGHSRSFYKIGRLSHVRAMARHCARCLAYSPVFELALDRIHSVQRRSGWDEADWSRALRGDKAAYLQPIVPNVARAKLTSVLLSRFRSGSSSVIDIGCGAGTVAEEVRGIGIRSYAGIDISPVAIDAAQQLYANNPGKYPEECVFATASLTGFSPTRTGVGAVVLNEVLYYLPTSRAALKEVRRSAEWLAQDGVVIISMKNDGKSVAIFRRIAAELRWLDGLLYQEKPLGPKFSTRVSRTHPAFVIGAFCR